jgi:phosphoglycolate phosphatase-like HAD superfamily hydrolase
MTISAAVLFDLDGTLTDSAAGIQRSTREALAQRPCDG